MNTNLNRKSNQLFTHICVPDYTFKILKPDILTFNKTKKHISIFKKYSRCLNSKQVPREYNYECKIKEVLYAYLRSKLCI